LQPDATGFRLPSLTRVVCLVPDMIHPNAHRLLLVRATALCLVQRQAG
jgi:hypothetical protein